jgi:hypothetical protein
MPRKRAKRGKYDKDFYISGLEVWKRPMKWCHHAKVGDKSDWDASVYPEKSLRAHVSTYQRTSFWIYDKENQAKADRKFRVSRVYKTGKDEHSYLFLEIECYHRYENSEEQRLRGGPTKAKRQ